MTTLPPAIPALELSALDTALLNNWQRNFPLVPRPFDHIACHPSCTPPCHPPCSESQVLARYRQLLARGALSRIGGVFNAGAGGASMLCALPVPASDLDRVAALVNRFDYVNHNYAREHAWNLWFVVTAPNQAERDACIGRIEALTGLRALRLPMKRVFRIDLGFDLNTGACPRSAHGRCAPLPAPEVPLAAALEKGLDLVPRPYAALAQAAGMGEDRVLTTLQRWQDQGIVRRLGTIVRHHELGMSANAMTVFNVPDEQLATAGSALAQQPGVTLCYARQRDEGWPYNLYCMVHGRTPDQTQDHIRAARTQARLEAFDHAVLFSTQRYKQTGGRYFSLAPLQAAQAEAA